MASVSLRDISKIFPNGARALDRVSLEVQDGELLTVVGPSGSGKTTLLRLIAGLDELSGGAIEIGGRPMAGVPPAGRDVAMVFQQPALLPHKSVAENMAFGLQLRRKTSTAEIQKAVERASMMLGIDTLLDRRPEQLSGGQRQRVALGRAIVRRPAVFLFDEPLSNLDGPLRVELRRDLKRLHRELAEPGTRSPTMIYVTHDQSEALTLGDRVAILDRGEIQQVDPPQRVYDEPRNTRVAEFLGSPPMNFLPGELREAGGKTCFAMRTWSLPVDRGREEVVQQWIGRKVLLGIRAEDVSLAAPEVEPVPPYASMAVVNESESLGDSTLVYLRLVDLPEGGPLGSSTVVSRREARVRLTPGARMLVYFDMQCAHFFDPETGRRVGRSEITPKGN